ncbi:MAG: HAD family hydrolase [Marivivens sp.]|nr:HAD family hydrolase [Marivivens sp.]
MTITPITGIVFDKDGTLFDFNATWGCWAGLLIAELAAGDAARHSALCETLGYDTVAKAFQPGSIVIAETVQTVSAAILPHLPAGTERTALIARMNALAADVPQVAAAPLPVFVSGLAARGLRLGVATNDAEAPARAHLARAGVLDGFDFVAGYDSGFGGKPAPGQLHAFCTRFSLAPESCVMVGDSLHDLHAGRALGMHTVGVLTGPALQDELAPHADAVLPSIAALPDWLDQVSRA